MLFDPIKVAPPYLTRLRKQRQRVQVEIDARAVLELIMPRPIHLRQIEAFKAVIENGTVSRAAEVLHITQSGMSKLIAHLEYDTGLELFERAKGRLVPTSHALRLYDEVGRIFSGVRQVENVIEAIRRERQGALTVGVLFALSGAFIQVATRGFREAHPGVFISLQTRSSPWILQLVAQRKLDVGVIAIGFSNPHVQVEPLLEHPLVCVMPLGHPLADLQAVRARDLEGVPFVSFDRESHTAVNVTRTLDDHGITLDIALTANMAPTLCELVAAGAGVSLIHPLMASGLADRIVLRPFEPEILSSFQICRSRDGKNAKLVDSFVADIKAAATRFLSSMTTA